MILFRGNFTIIIACVGLIKVKYIVKGICFFVTNLRIIYLHITHTNIRPSSQDPW